MRDFCHALLLPHRVYLAPILFIIPFVMLEFVLKKKGLYLLNIADPYRYCIRLYGGTHTGSTPIGSLEYCWL